MPSKTTPRSQMRGASSTTPRSQNRGASGGKNTPSSSRGKKVPSSKEQGLDPDLVDDVDKFVDLRNKNMFGDDADADSQGSDGGEEMVLGIGADDEDEDEDEDDDNDDDEDEDDEDDVGDDLGSDVEPEDQEAQEEGWGKRRSDYYDADEADDSEAEAEEEKEALRLRAKQSDALKTEDFGEDDIASSGEESETLAAAISKESSANSLKREKQGRAKSKETAKPKKKKSGKASKADASALTQLDEELEALEDTEQVEKVERDLSGLTTKEKLDILENDAPELLVLLGDFKKYISEIRTQLIPIKERLKQGGLKTASGVSYLELKLQLLLSYCTNVSFYLLLKSEGRSIKNHPVIEQLVELRTLMEKMRPLDAKLKYQMDKLLKTPLAAGHADAAETADALRFKPNPDALLNNGLDGLDDAGDEDGAGGTGADGLYRPPKITAMHFEDAEDAKKRKARERRAAKARKSEIVQALREEFDDAPLEMPNIGSAAQYRDEEEEHRTRFEEENFIRLTVSKKERSRLAKARQGGAAFESFEDFGDIDLSVDRDEDRAAIGVLKKRSLEEYISSQEQERRARRKKEASGEADVPVRDRHAIIQHVAQRKQALAARAGGGGHTGGDDESVGGGGSEGEDETYEAVRVSKAAAKAARAARYERGPAEYREEADVGEGEKREAGRAIVKNRGLVPHRSRDKKNPRVKHRIKYDKAKTKERTSLYGRQKREDKAAYAGEATGIKPNVSRSRRL